VLGSGIKFHMQTHEGAQREQKEVPR